jgi:hypothetical protein
VCQRTIKKNHVLHFCPAASCDNQEQCSHKRCTDHNGLVCYYCQCFLRALHNQQNARRMWHCVCVQAAYLDEERICATCQGTVCIYQAFSHARPTCEVCHKEIEDSTQVSNTSTKTFVYGKYVGDMMRGVGREMSGCVVDWWGWSREVLANTDGHTHRAGVARSARR